jgi:hypothetical protein
MTKSTTLLIIDLIESLQPRKSWRRMARISLCSSVSVGTAAEIGVVFFFLALPFFFLFVGMVDTSSESDERSEANVDDEGASECCGNIVVCERQCRSRTTALVWVFVPV